MPTTATPETSAPKAKDNSANSLGLEYPPSKLLQDFMKKKGLSNSSFAELVSVSRHMVRKFVGGANSTELRFTHIMKILAPLGLNLSHVLRMRISDFLTTEDDLSTPISSLSPEWFDLFKAQPHLVDGADQLMLALVATQSVQINETLIEAMDFDSPEEYLAAIVEIAVTGFGDDESG